MAKLRVRKRKNLPKKKAQPAQRKISSSFDDSESDSRSSTGSCTSGSDYSSSRSRSGSSSPGSSSGEDVTEYRKGGYHPVIPFQLYAGRYRVLGKLGAGAFSTVWLCCDEKAKHTELVAMKICKSSRSVCEQTLDEIKLLDALSSNYTMSLKTHFWHSGPHGNHKCLIFELMGENLLALVRHFNDEGLPLRWVKKIAYDSLQGLAHCHSRKVIHTDIKLENVLITRHDMAELIQEADEALAILRKREAILAKRNQQVPVDTTNMSKSKKKRLKKKNKKAATEAAQAAENGENAEENGDEDKGGNEEEEEEEELPELPSILTRQKCRFDDLTLSTLQCKITDFGNGCWIDKHFTEEIQTRQYRSPEALLGQAYDESTDIWSVACMIFELLTGEFLFAPRSSRKWSRDEDHISLIIELLGTYPPPNWALKGKYAKGILTNEGKPKKIKSLKFWNLEDVMIDKYCFSKKEASDFCDFLLPMLEWLPKDRVTAEEALKHPWLADALSEDEELHIPASVLIRRRRKSCDDVSSVMSHGSEGSEYFDIDEERRIRENALSLLTLSDPLTEPDEGNEGDNEDNDENEKGESCCDETSNALTLDDKPRIEAKAAPTREDKSVNDANSQCMKDAGDDAVASPKYLSSVDQLRYDEFHDLD